jgi:hypothetical protein
MRVVVTRPAHGEQKITLGFAQLRIFPDNKPQEESAFKQDGVTLTGKPQGHLVVARQHMEKWALAGKSDTRINLSPFADSWIGCSIRIEGVDDS